MRTAYYFYMKTDVWSDFQIYISVPLTGTGKFLNKKDYHLNLMLQQLKVI